MKPENRPAGPEDPPVHAPAPSDDKMSAAQEPSRRSADLRTLIQGLKENEKQLSIRCSLLQGVIAGANAAIFSLDPDRRYTSSNKKHADDMQELYGTLVSAGESLEHVIPVERDLSLIDRLARRALAGEEGSAAEWFGSEARGSRYFELFSYPVGNDDGFITGAAVIAVDTTLRKQMENELREHGNLFRGLADNFPDLVYRVSIPGGKYEYISPSALPLTGYSPEEFTKKPGLLYDLIHSASKDAYGRNLELLMKGDNPPAAEYLAVHRNGEQRWWSIRTTIIRDASDNPVAYEGILTDITERTNELAAIREAEERFRSIVQSADAGILLVDARTHGIVDANPRALEMFGLPRDRVVGSVCHRFICPAEAGKCPVTDLRERVDESERNILTAGGTTVPVLKTVVPVTISGTELLIETFIDISEQKRTQDALRESEERYRAFITNSTEGIFRFEADDGISVSLPQEEQVARLTGLASLAECNDAMARMYGYEHAGDLIGRKLRDFIDPADPRSAEFLREFIRNGYHIADYGIGSQDPKKDPRWFAVTMNSVVTDGRITRIWGVLRDITDRRNAEIVLRKSEAQYRELVEHSADIIFTLSFSGEITSVNPAVTPLLGYNPEEMIGKAIGRFVREESQAGIKEEIDRRTRSASADTFYEVDIRSNDGRFIPFELTIRVRSEGRKDPDLIGIARDISVRKNVEGELRESEERFRTLLQSVPSVAVQGFRPDYTVVYWNEASTRMFGYSAEEAMGRDIRELLIPPESRDEATAACDTMAASGIPGPSAEQDLLHRDGRRVPVFISHTVVTIPQKSTILFCVSVDLTARKSAEKALRDAERRLQSILDVAPFGTFVYELIEDGSLIFVSGNESANRILATDCSRFEGMTIEQAFPALAGTRIPDAYRNVVRNGEPFSSEGFVYEEAGIRGIFEIHAVPLGQNRMAIFFRDISEKKKADEELARSETRFRALIQNSSDIIQILDRDGKLVYSSPAFSTILGYPEGTQNARSLLDLVHPDDRRRVAADLEEVYARTNPGTPTEYRMMTADNNALFVESIGVNLLDVPGVDGIVINTHEVHERKLAEQALSESEERFRIIFQHSNDSLYLFEITPSGMPGKIVDANNVATSQTGFSREELAEKTLPDLCTRDLSQRARAIMMELLTRGEARFETEKIRKDGSLLPVEISARLAKIRDKTYVIAISRDISRRKREERALRIANQKLQLMNIVAWHDIQNKVTGLRGYVELSKDLATDEKLKKFIESEEEVLRVIHRQLQYTKEYQEMGIHPPQWVNLPQVLRTIISFIEIGPIRFGMELRDLELYCDPVIEKVFTHLIENTVKHGVRATMIRISCGETPAGLVLVYEDDGVGISPEKKKELFVRGVGSDTGFSLFFVHDILEISDMSIRETGEPGKGARFEITIPRGLYRGESGRE